MFMTNHLEMASLAELSFIQVLMLSLLPGAFSREAGLIATRSMPVWQPWWVHSLSLLGITLLGFIILCFG